MTHTTQRTKQGTCPLCQREHTLTFHHLIPRKMHRRTHFRKHYDKKQLNQGINICRQCHNGIHRQYGEMQLAKTLNTLELLANDEILMHYFHWVSKQKIS